MRAFFKLILVLPMVLFVSLATAATPTVVSYQGSLYTSGGSPVPDSIFSIVFTIYDAATGPAPRWTETQSVSTLGGLFTVYLGAVNPLVDSIFSSTNRYLGIKVGTDAEIVPRMQLVTVPYAYRVSSIDGANGGYIFGSIRMQESSGGGTIGAILVDTPFGNQYFIHNSGPGNSFLGISAGASITTGDSNTAVGERAMILNASGRLNSAFGAQALHDNYGFNNTAIGYAALRSGTAFENCTAVGSQALYNNDMDGNTAVGFKSLYKNYQGFLNTAIGYASLMSNVSGVGNTACGSNALSLNTSGGNTANGASSLSDNTTGSSNTASGVNTLANNVSGRENTAVGANALANSTTADSNTAAGSSALLNNTTGDRNAALGVNALRANTTGLDNTGIGTNALYSNSLGKVNTSVGTNSLYNNTTADSNTAIGYQSLYGNTVGLNNTASGTRTLYNNTSGSSNTAFGQNALTSNTVGSSNTALGFNANVMGSSQSNSTAIGANATVNASNKIRLGNSSVTVIEGQVAYTFTSDKNQKENFQPLDGDEVLKKIADLDVSSWNYIGQDPNQFRHYGPVAQEFFAAFGHDGVGTAGTPTTINSGDMAGVMLKAIQALEKENANLKGSVQSLEQKLEALQQELEK